jgi:hypothetical protein
MLPHLHPEDGAACSSVMPVSYHHNTTRHHNPEELNWIFAVKTSNLTLYKVHCSKSVTVKYKLSMKTTYLWTWANLRLQSRPNHKNKKQNFSLKITFRNNLFSEHTVWESYPLASTNELWYNNGVLSNSVCVESIPHFSVNKYTTAIHYKWTQNENKHNQNVVWSHVTQLRNINERSTYYKLFYWTWVH